MQINLVVADKGIGSLSRSLSGRNLRFKQGSRGLQLILITSTDLAQQPQQKDCGTWDPPPFMLQLVNVKSTRDIN